MLEKCIRIKFQGRLEISALEMSVIFSSLDHSSAVLNIAKPWDLWPELAEISRISAFPTPPISNIKIRPRHGEHQCRGH